MGVGRGMIWVRWTEWLIGWNIWRLRRFRGDQRCHSVASEKVGRPLDAMDLPDIRGFVKAFQQVEALKDSIGMRWHTDAELLNLKKWYSRCCEPGSCARIIRHDLISSRPMR